MNFGKIKYYGFPKTGFPKLGFQSCLVVGCERVDDDGDGECEDEDAGDGGEAADELAEVRPGVGCRDEIKPSNTVSFLLQRCYVSNSLPGVEVVADGGDGHQAPPE